MTASRLTRSALTVFAFIAALAAALLVATQTGRSQRAVAAAPGPIAWLPADGHANDLQGTNHGTLQGGATYGPGKVGQAFVLDGDRDYVDVQGSPAIGALASLTAATWINPQMPELANNGVSVVFATRRPLASEGFMFMVTSAGELDIRIKTNGQTLFGTEFVSAPSVIRFDNQFKHVAVTYDAAAGVLKAYVDGSEVALRNVSNATLGGPVDNPDYFYLGQRQDISFEGAQGASYFKGAIDEFRLFDRALTRTEILETAGALVVTNTADSGPGSLRQAILDANAAPGAQIIGFNIPGAGVHTIAPLSALPQITSTVRIDGYTQPGARPNSLAVGSDAVLLVELNGANLSGAPGLDLQWPADNCVVRGLVINRFFNSMGLEVWSGGNVIEGNYIGTDASGAAALGNANGVRLISGTANNNLIGGTTPAARNVISGNRFFGVTTSFHHSGTRIQGNYIGVNAAGMSALGNGLSGVSLDNPGTVGGAEPGAGNVISANGSEGVVVTASPSAVLGNLIGTRADGAGALGNGNYAVAVGNANVVLGGTEAGAGNTFAFNGRGGVGLFGFSNSVSVLGNSIYANDARAGGAGLGIDIGGDGLTPNDAGDADAGPNRAQNFPVIDFANSNGLATNVHGTLDSEAGATYTLHFYSNAECDPSGHGEGQTYLGSATATTGAAAGGVSFSASFPVVVAQGQFITATATHPANGTSEFSPCRPVSFTRPPDLQLSAMSAPPQALTDAAFDLAWTLTNGGEETASGPWADRVFLSSDDRLDGGDTRLADFPFTQSVGPGQSAGRVQSVTIPRAAVAQDGQYFLIISADADNAVIEGSAEGNNLRAVPLAVSRALLPDLVVDMVEAPAAAFFDQTVTVRWGVRNVGNASTNAPEWGDRVYLSSDQVIDQSDITHGAQANVSYLGAGERYEATAEFHIPRGLTGAHYLIVQTDASHQLAEHSEGNNAQPRLVSLQIPPLPDLSVTLAQGPQQAVAGGDIFINWRVENRGEADTRADQTPWADGFYLSRDEVFSPSTDRFIGSLTRGTGSLARGEGYTVVGHKVELPRDIAGDWRLFVVADFGNVVYEFANESNNAAHDARHHIDIRATPPDLIASTVTAPATASAGQAIEVSFTVTNQGAFAAGGSWQDSVYISADATLDTASDTLLQTVVHNGGLDPATSYVVAPSVTLPHCLSGTFYLFAVTDRANQIFEFAPDYDAERNNSGPARQIQLTSAPPDLQVTALAAPSAGTAGQPLSLTWTVSNAGVGPATRALWVDRVYLSRTPALDTRAAQHVASFVRDGALAAGESYARAETVTLPADAHGPYHLFVQTDSADEVKECAGEGNNARAAAPALDVDNTLPDLTVTAVEAPAEVFANQTITVQWSGRNGGAGGAGQAGWKDAVYLSADATLDDNEKPLALALVGGPLAAGGVYSAQAHVKLPSVPAGDYFLIVKADAERFVFEGAREDNNHGARAVRVRVPDVDLRVTGLTAPADAPSGDFVNVGWTVTNAGASATLASEWSDYVLLSRDQIADPTDTVIGHRQRAQPLAAGQSYDAAVAAEIPHGLSGQYYLFVRSDRNGAVAELDEANNDGGPHGLLLRLPPPVDLTAHTLAAPASGFVGEPFALSWRVENTGDNATPSQWTDAVYLSADAAWDSSDVLLARVPNRNALAPGQSYAGSTGGLLPPVNPGQYYVIVRADVRNRVREVSETNNAAATSAPSVIDVRELPLNTPFTRPFMAAGQELYFKTAAPAGETLLYTLDSAGGASTEMFARHGSIVTPSAFDFASDRPNEGDQEIVVPDALPGLYYNLSRVLYVAPLPDFNGQPVAATSVTLKAEIIPFGIRSVSPARIGDNGQVTLTLRGAKFQPGATVQLVNGGTTLTASNVTVLESGTVAKARFQFADAPRGVYDVRLTNTSAAATSLQSAVTIEKGTKLLVSTDAVSTGQPRVGAPWVTAGTVTNVGNVDVPYTVVRFRYNRAVNVNVSRPQGTLPIQEQSPEAQVGALSPTAVKTDEATYDYFVIRDLGAGQSVPFESVVTDYGTTPFSSDITAIALYASQFYDIARGSVEDSRLAWLDDPSAGSALPSDLLDVLGDSDAWWEFHAEAMSELGYFEDASPNPVQNPVQKYVQSPSFTRWPRPIGPDFDWNPSNCEDTQACTVATKKQQIFCYALGCLPLVAKSVHCRACTGGVWVTRVFCYGISIGGDDTTGCLLNDVCHNIGFGIIGKIADGAGVGICPEPQRPADPNDKQGPTGYGPQKFVGAQQPLPYTVNFENVPTASAYAQRITITDQLDASLDWRTLRLREIGFGKYRVTAPENRAYHQARVPLGADLGSLHADISAFLDVATGRVTWTLTAIDPATGEQPNGALQGLLPPNDETGRGQGFVTYTVRAKSDAPTGTQITNRATIVFDTEEAITTNTVANTLDSDAPASAVAALPASSQPTFSISWSGADPANGSGLRSYDVFVSEGDGPFEPFVSGTEEVSAQFTGQPGRTYRFYSLARDNAGNVEAAPAAPDAVTSVAGQSSLTGLSLNPDAVTGGESAQATVTLGGPAPQGGAQAALASDHAAAVAPPHVLIPEGATSAVFTVTTGAVAAVTQANISATYGGVTRTAILTLKTLPGLSVADASVAEPLTGTANATFEVSLSAPSAQAVTVSYATADDTATSGVDYVQTFGTLTFNPGETSKSFTVPVNADDAPEGSETFFVNLSSPTGAVVADGQGVAAIIPTASAGSVLVSEFRFRGPGGAADEFVEFYNNTDSDITVSTHDGSQGWALASSGGVTHFVIPNGAVIPARGHLLAVNSAGYSLSSSAAGDVSYTADIPDNAGFALFRTASPQSFDASNRLDAVGPSGGGDALYREGAGYTPLNAVVNTEHSFLRDLSAGTPKDTNDNAADFLFVEVNGGSFGPAPRLGTPGPENLSSPAQRNSAMPLVLFDATQPASAPPNRIRGLANDPQNNSTFGTLTIRRRVVNNTGRDVTRLRFRIVNITTYPSPLGTADLRARVAPGVRVSNVMDAATCAETGDGLPPCAVTVVGTVLDEPPAQTNGGGWNSTLSVPVTLAPEQSVNVQFLLGVEATGAFRFYLIIEADEQSPPAPAVAGDKSKAAGE